MSFHIHCNIYINRGPTVAEKDMVNIWTLIRHPTASLGVLEPLYFLIVMPCHMDSSCIVAFLYQVLWSRSAKFNFRASMVLPHRWERFSKIYSSVWMPASKFCFKLNLISSGKSSYSNAILTLWIWRSQIKLFAHESATIAASIECLRSPEAINSETAGGWLKEFRTPRLCSKASLEAGILNIRFVVDDALIVSTTLFFSFWWSIESQDDDSSLMSRQTGKSAEPSTALFSMRKCLPTQF